MKSDEVLVNIRKIVRGINLESKRIQKSFGISIPQLLCLTFLKGRPKFSANHKEIKDYLNLNASTVTGIIFRLVQKGLVEKETNPQDKRVVAVKLTAKGLKLFQDAPELLHSKLEDKLNLLPEEKLLQLKTALDDLVDLMDLQALEASPMITLSDPIQPE